MGKYMKKERVFYYDALKAIAIIGIIACHMSGSFLVKTDIASLKWYFLLALNTLRQFSIPAFVMISGALLVNKDYSLSAFIKKKFNRILVPYIFWAIMLLLFSYLLIRFGIKANVISTFTPQYIINCFLGLTKGITKGRSFWFIWMILVVYVVLYLLNQILNKVSEDANRKMINGLALFFIVYCLIIVPSGMIKIGAFNNTLLFYISFAGYGLFGYFLANTDFSNISDRLKLSKKTVFYISFALFILLFIYSLINITDLSLAHGRLTTFPYFGILTLALSSTAFLSFRYFEEANKDDENSMFMKIKNGKLGIALNSLSKCSFGIYFVHPLIYVFFKDILFASMDIFNRNPIKWSLFLIVLVLFTSWAIILIMSKIPYLDKVSGT